MMLIWSKTKLKSKVRAGIKVSDLT